MRIGILGSGRMGGTLGAIFARAGHDVTFSYAHSEKKLARRARTAGRGARTGTPREAVDGADAVLLAVHWSRVKDVLKQAGSLSRKIIVSCSLPMNAADTELVVAHTSSGAEALARLTRGAHVVSAFSTAPSEALMDVYQHRRRRRRPGLVYCGDHAAAKRVAARLIGDAGFDPRDAGPLRIARFIEPFSLLVAQLAYEQSSSPRLTYRFERYGR
jgi:predicted dinucleotide-binding enzyme